MSTLRLNNVTKKFASGKVAVSGFNIDVPEKEFIVIVGPSGCGKTTLLRLIAGLESVTEGEIYIDGVNVNNVRPKDRSVTLVFQNFALFPYMTAYENIAFGLKIAGKKKDEIDAKVMEAANILGITEELDRKPRALSGGQRQRVALGRAMVLSPKFFLLDEPLSNLDPKLRAEMRSQIKELYEKLDATFIYVTHDQVEAMTMGTRIVVLNEGNVQQIASPRRIYDCPANKFVASFIGSEMNFFNGTLKRQADHVLLTMPGSNIMLPLSTFDKADSTYLDGSRDVTVGLRAEDIFITSDTKEQRIKARVKAVEVLGRDSVVYAEVGGENMIFNTSEKVNKGDVITIAFNKQKLHFFSAQTGKNIIDYEA